MRDLLRILGTRWCSKYLKYVECTIKSILKTLGDITVEYNLLGCVAWLDGRVVREPGLWWTSRGFEFRPQRCRMQPWGSCLHTCASVTKQYNLVPANRRWCLAVEEVTADLAESNGSLPPGLWLQSSSGWLPRTGISSGTLRLFTEYIKDNR